MVNLGGFDTHSAQVDNGNPAQGYHADLLGQLSEAISAFMVDLTFLSIENRVVGMTFSEFGRRIASNASLGSDHGAAAPMFVFGSQVQSGILGTNPVINQITTSSDNVPMQYDFRSVYASLLQDWLCVPGVDLATIMLQNFQTLPIINSSACSGVGIHDLNQMAGETLISNYPNPFDSSTYITFKTFGGHTLIQVFDTQGHLIKTPVDGEFEAGTHKVWFENQNYPAGVYYARLENGALQQVTTMVIVR